MAEFSKLETEIIDAVGAAPDEAALEAVRVAALGRNGSITALLKTLGGMTPEERKAQGPAINGLKDRATQALNARRDALSSWPQSFNHADFAWVTPPVLNPYTRIAVEMCAASGVLRAVGYELERDSPLPQPVTHVRELAASVANVPA